MIYTVIIAVITLYEHITIQQVTSICSGELTVTLMWFQVRLKSPKYRTDHFLNIANHLQAALQCVCVCVCVCVRVYVSVCLCG